MGFKNWLLCGSLAVLGVVLFVVWKNRDAEAQETSGNGTATQNGIAVQVVKPTPGGLERKTIQPASVQSFDWVDKFAQVSGVLEKQDVDIGSRVKKGQLLAEIMAPELIKEQAHAAAALEQAKAQVIQAKKHVIAVEARSDLTPER